MPRRTTARASIGLAVAFLALLAALHALEPEFNGRLISEYQLSDYGLLMSLAFCALGASALLVARALGPVLRARSGGPGVWGLFAVGAGLFVSGLFPPVHAPAIVGYLHIASAVVVILGSPLAFAYVDGVLARFDPALPPPHRLRWATMLAWSGLVSFLASFIIVAPPVLAAISRPGPLGSPLSPWVSAANRFMIVTYCLWLIAAAWGAVGKPAAHPKR